LPMPWTRYQRWVDLGDRASLSSLLPQREKIKIGERPVRHTLN
jgi:hypothetical protein